MSGGSPRRPLAMSSTLAPWLRMREADDDAGEGALEHEVGADGEQRRRRWRGEYHGSRRPTPSAVVAEGLEDHEHHADHDEVDADVEGGRAE